ncbi:MAG: hypothetical protein CVU43_06295 [Chloroflexi bacterium HGW-Chloroflexi-5]|jgi:hypothetical protein|nr:MAG: hypothetical protein CVU43_06295 [Chloroflexi bacterium HGW-Chloroflexi-5]
MKKITGLILLCAFLLSSCKPNALEVAIAIGLTQTASIPLATNTQEPISTNTPTINLEPTGTSTPVIDFGSSTTLPPIIDLRVVNGAPLDFQIKPSDLPKESMFYLPNSTWTSRLSNNEIINGWTVDYGREYLEKTGRVDGWWTYLARGSQKLTAPEEVFCNVVQYKTTEGARISLTEYNVLVAPKRTENFYYTIYKASEEFPDLGDTSIAHYYDKTVDSGEKYTEYSIESTYFNYLIECSGYGRKIEVKPDYVANLVQIIINKMEEAGLVEP